MNRRLVALVALAIAGCALYSDVTIVPLTVQPPTSNIGTDLTSMIRKADLVRAVRARADDRGEARRTAQELAALGSAELICRPLRRGPPPPSRRARPRAVPHDVRRQVAWDLSQLEYMTNNYESSLDWARIADEHGMRHQAVAHSTTSRRSRGVDVYRFSGKHASASRCASRSPKCRASRCA